MSLDVLRQLTRSAAVRLVQTGIAHAKLVVLGGLVLTGLLAWYAAAQLTLNTDTADMLDPELPFLKRSNEFRALFPQFNDLLVVVVEADSRAAAQDGADALAARLAANSERLRSVYRPGTGSYFATHGLLYLSEDALWEIDDELAAAQTFLGTVAADPSLRGLLGSLGHAFERDLDGSERALFAKILDRIAGVTEAQLAGRGRPLAWRDEFFADFQPGSGPPREFILVQPRFDYASLEPAKVALRLVREAGRELAAERSGVRVRLTGSVAMEDEELASVARDSTLTSVLSFVLVFAILVWGVRSAGVIVAILANLVLGLIATAAFAAAVIGGVNLISVCFAVLFIGMGVDFGIQFGLRYREDSVLADRRAALVAAAGGVGGALTLAAVAAAISFFAFVPTSYRGLGELGIIAGTSMFIGLFTTLLYLPAWLAVLPTPKRPTTADTVALGESAIVRHRRPLLAVVALMVFGAVAVGPRVSFDFNPLNLKDPSTESVAMFRDLLADPNTTPYTIQILAADVAAASALAARLEALPEVDKAVTLSSLVPAGQQAKLEIIDGMRIALEPALEPEPAPPPTSAERHASVTAFVAGLEQAAGAGDAYGAAARRLAAALRALGQSGAWPDEALVTLERNLIGDLPLVIAKLRDLLQAGPVTLADLPEDLASRYRATDGRVRVEVYPAHDLGSNQALRQFVRAVQAVAPDATDTPVMLLEGGDAVIEATVTATALALLATALLLAVWLRDLFAVLLVLLPLSLALVMMVASSVVFRVPFNLANIIALPLLIGLNNAYGAYLVLRHRELGDVSHLLRSSTPRAVFSSGMTTMASFGTLSLSSHPGTASMGMFISLAIVYALFFALVVQPAVLAELDARRAGIGT